LIGIYQDDFIDFLRQNLGDHIKTSSKNIICPCPWCEYQKERDHYHMYISIEAPIFHCFHGSCEQSGTLPKLLTKIQGHDISEVFIDKSMVQEYSKQKDILADKDEKLRNISLPVLKPDQFPFKDLYVKKRLKFANIPTKLIKGLIYDIESFIQMNQIPMDETLFKLTSKTKLGYMHQCYHQDISP